MIKENLDYLLQNNRLEFFKMPDHLVLEDCKSKRLQGFEKKYNIIDQVDLHKFCHGFWNLDERDEGLQGLRIFSSGVRVILKTKEGFIFPLGNAVTFVSFDTTWKFQFHLMDTNCRFILNAVPGDQTYIFNATSWRFLYRQMKQDIKLKNNLNKTFGTVDIDEFQTII
jgi:hypothetical protein